jgi:adenylate cyclase
VILGRGTGWKNRLVAIDFEAEGLLKGTRGRNREARLQLLTDLAADGVELGELRRAVAEDRLALVGVERLLEGGGRRYSATEVAEIAGVELEVLRRQRQALGLPGGDPDEPAYTEEDLDAARRLRSVLDAGLGPDDVYDTARVMGLAASQLAAANRAVVGEAMLRKGDTELEAARRYSEAATALLPLLVTSLEHVLKLHIREQLRHDAIGSAELASGSLSGSQEVSVCFADLVGFTKLGERLPADELAAVTGRLDELARACADPPVRLVKMIGDAAMLVSPDNLALLDASIALVDAAEVEGEGFPGLRAGVARGAALSRAGDWYGRPVNLASRITEIAYPGSVLCSAEVREGAADGFRWSNAGRRRLKGIKGSTQVFRVRRRDDGGSGG